MISVSFILSCKFINVPIFHTVENFKKAAAMRRYAFLHNYPSLITFLQVATAATYARVENFCILSPFFRKVQTE